MGFDYPWHPYFLWWFVMLVVGPRPSLFWRRTSLHHLGYLGSLFSLSKLPKFARCYAYGIAEATRNACHAIKGAGPIQSSKNLHIHSCDFMIWIADTLSQGHYPAHILLIPFARFCFDCACNVENAWNLKHSYLTVIPLPTAVSEGCHGLSHFSTGCPFPFTRHCHWERDDPNSYWR